MKLENLTTSDISIADINFLPLYTNSETIFTFFAAPLNDISIDEFVIAQQSDNILKQKKPAFLLLMQNEDEDSWDDSTVINHEYKFLRTSSFVKFFNTQTVAVPQCFVKTKSLRRLNFELLFIRLVTYLMKQGQKEKALILFTSAAHLFYKSIRSSFEYVSQTNFLRWQFIYFLINNLKIDTSTSNTYTLRKIVNLSFQHVLRNESKYYFINNYMWPTIQKNLFIFTPIFSFSLFNLDKRARKRNKKNKSKYIFIWKYLPVYKRKAFFLKLFAKDIKFIVGKSAIHRLFLAFTSLKTTPEKNHSYQVNTFTHNYVFKNLRKSLLKNFKTTAK